MPVEMVTRRIREDEPKKGMLVYGYQRVGCGHFLDRTLLPNLRNDGHILTCEQIAERGPNGS